MIPPDRKSISISSNHPHGKVRVCRFHTGCHGRCTTMNGMKSVGIHVIRKATGTSDSTDHDKLFLGHTKFGQGSLNRVKDGIVSASRTPADIIFSNKILLSKAAFFRIRCAHLNICWLGQFLVERITKLRDLKGFSLNLSQRDSID